MGKIGCGWTAIPDQLNFPRGVGMHVTWLRLDRNSRSAKLSWEFWKTDIMLRLDRNSRSAKL